MLNGLAVSRIPAEDEALRPAVRDLVARLVADRPLSERARGWMAGDPAFSRALGEAGLLGLTLPREYGGGGRGPFARYVVAEELLAVGAPVALHWIADRQSALLILNFGSEGQKRAYLPRICRGEAFFCIGMSEPGAGSDLAAVRSRAVRAPGGWRVSGQKIWTTMAHHCHHMLALVRTSEAGADRHAGLSQFIIDLDAPGVTVRPIADANGNEDFNEIFLDDVLLGEDALLGEEGAGWAQVNAELAFERSGPERIWSSNVLLDAWVEHVKAQGEPGEARLRLAGGLTARLAALRALSLAVTARLAAGERPLLESSLLKDLGTTFEQEVPLALADDLAARPDEAVGPELRAALLHLLAISPAFSLRGGTREILRGIIARGLGLR